MTRPANAAVDSFDSKLASSFCAYASLALAISSDCTATGSLSLPGRVSEKASMASSSSYCGRAALLFYSFSIWAVTCETLLPPAIIYENANMSLISDVAMLSLSWSYCLSLALTDSTFCLPETPLYILFLIFK